MQPILIGVTLQDLKPTTMTILGICMVAITHIGDGTEVGDLACHSDGVAHLDGAGEVLGDITLGALDMEVSTILSGVADTTDTVDGMAVDTGVMAITTDLYTEEAVAMELALTE